MNALSVVRVALKRLWNNKGLTFCAIVGLIVAVGLISSVPLYTDAANFKVLEEQLERGSADRRHPPFAFMYRYIGAWHGPIEWSDYQSVNEYISESVPGVINLPVELTTRYVRTDNFSLFPASEAAYIGLRQPLGWINLAFIDNIQDHIHILEGQYPADAAADAEIFDVMVSHAFALETGLQVGEEYVAFMRGGSAESAARPTQLALRVSGVWAPRDESDPIWFYSPRSLETSLLITPETFRLRIAPSMQNEVYAAVWYTVFDGQNVRTDDVPSLLGRMTFANTHVSRLLPNTVLDVSPMDALQTYRWTTFVMTIVLYVFSVPILGLVLYFIGVISGLIVTRQRVEIAILKSRGAGDLQVLGIYALEGALIGIVGLGLGLLLGRWLALIMGNTISFMAFGQRVPLPVMMTPRSIRLGLVGVGIALLASLLPAMQAARLTIVTYKQDRARSMERPFWQRYFLDILLLAPVIYGYYVLDSRGTIGILGDGTGDPFQDPLLFLVPSLAIMAFSLLMVRIFPLLMELLAWITSHLSRSVSVVLAFRQLARVSRQYTGSLLLLILTLSLATFTASMARTLDQSLIDRMYYRYGADYHLVEVGEPPPENGGNEEASDASMTATESGGWVFVPVSEHLKVDGIEAATRVGVYRTDALIGNERYRGVFYGIDRLDFPKVAFFRRDFASNQLGVLMNRLAIDHSAMLVSPNFMSDHRLQVGDTVTLRISAWGGQAEAKFIIADAVRYFPTFYPDNNENRYLFVGNLDYLFQEMGGLFPYDVWVRASRPLDVEQVRSDLYSLDINVLRMQGSLDAVDREQARPERTGVFGILSVGFVAAAMLTVLGFLLHSFISFRQRYIEFGVLRAIGLSVGQMIGFLGIEQLTLILTGTTAGTILGVWVSRVFIPFLQVGTAANINVPPFVVLIAWEDIITIYLVFGAMLICAVAGMIWFLLHLRIFEAVKLGEAV